MTARPRGEPDVPTTEPPKPVITRSQIVWRGDELFDAGPPGRAQLVDGQAKQAPGPVETLLNALSACASVDVIAILAKRRTPVEHFSVQIAAERRPQFPRRVRRVQMEFRIDGAAIDRENAERAIQLGVERYCSVAASLSPDTVIETRLALNGESFPAVRQKPWVPADAMEPPAE